MASPKTLNPFPGLRSFRIDEKYLFFGREEHTVELLRRLRETRFLAVVGTSGSGKSSLVKAGVLPELHKGTMTRAGSSWEVAVMRPGGSPMTNLALALIEADLYDPEQADVVEQVRATLSRSRHGLTEAARQSDLEEGTNLLVVVDQFEELFRFRRSGAARDQAEAVRFVELLLSASAGESPPVYVVLTMRSDYLGDCTTFPGLAEAVNAAEFLIPRMNREQRRAAIEGPVKVAGAAIAPRLLHKLLNDLGDSPDQLPILQHALMRTWDVWTQSGGSDALDLDDYHRIGSMAEALSHHADEVYHALPGDQEREWCRGIFEALTVKEAENRGIRRPQRLSALGEILEVPVEKLVPVIDAFRRPGVTFLMPPPEVELTRDTIIDISHESLMRVWVRLRHWVEEEAQAAAIYRRVAENAELHAQGKTGLIRDPELSLAQDWLRRSRHANAAWAERYRPGFADAMAFLDQSKEAAEAEEREKEAARQRELEQAQALAKAQQQRAEEQRRSAVRLRWLVAGSLLMAAVAFAAYLSAQRAEQNASAARADAEAAWRRSDQVRLAAQAATLKDKLPMRAMLLASEAIESARDSGAQPPTLALEVLHETLGGVRGTYFDSAPIWKAELSADGRWLLGQSLANANPLWRLEPGATTYTRKLLLAPGYAQAISPDCRWLAIGDHSGVVHLYDLSKSDPASSDESWQAHPAAVDELLFTPDGGRLISASDGDEICKLWSLEKAPGSPADEIPVSFTRLKPNVDPGGTLLAICGVGAPFVEIYDISRAEAPRLKWRLPVVEEGRWREPCFSPDSRYFSSSLWDRGDEIIQLWDLETENPADTVRTIRNQGALRAGFTTDGRYLFSGAEDNSVHLFPVGNEGRGLVLRGHASAVFAIASSPSGKLLATGSNDHSVRLWNLEDENPHDSVQVLAGHEDNVRTLSFAPDGDTLYSADEGGTVRSWQLLREPMLAPGRAVPVAPGGLMRTGFPTAYGSSKVETSGYIVTELPGGHWRRWNLDVNDFEGEDLGDFRGQKLAGRAKISGDGRWMIIRVEGSPVLLEFTGSPGESRVRKLPGHEGRLRDFLFASDSRFALTAGADLRVLRWDLAAPDPSASSEVIAELPSEIESVRLSTEGRWLFVSCADSTLHQFDLDGDDRSREVLEAPAAVWTMKLSPDGRQLAGAMRGQTLGIWRRNVRAGSMELREVIQGANLFGTMLFSPDSRYLVAAEVTGTGLHLYDTAAENIQASRRPLGGHSSWVFSGAYSSDGRWLATGEVSGEILVRDMTSTESDKHVLRLRGYKHPSYGLHFFDGGRRLASASVRGGGHIWELNEERLVKLAREAAGRELSEDERRQYGIAPTGKGAR